MINTRERNKRRRERYGHKCVNCGIIISPEATRCVKCAMKFLNERRRNGRIKYKQQNHGKQKNKVFF